jgi:hypothetical protein
MIAWRNLGAAFIVLTAGAVPVDGGGAYFVAPAYPAYYPAPVRTSWSCSYPAAYFYAPSVPITVIPWVPLATPTPAPPSNAPGVRKSVMPSADGPSKQAQVPVPAPSVVESRTGTSGDAVSDRFRVGFWNAAGRDVTLVVEGRSHRLTRDRALTLELPRTFSWQVDQEAGQTGRVPEGKTTLEVVIR